MGSENKNEDSKNNATSEESKASIYENRPGMKKIIRVLTVLAYLVSVSFVAIVLSGYYVFLWHPPNPTITMQAALKSSDVHAEYLIDPKPSNIKLQLKNNHDIVEKIYLFNHNINNTNNNETNNLNDKLLLNKTTTIKNQNEKLINGNDWNSSRVEIKNITKKFTNDWIDDTTFINDSSTMKNINKLIEPSSIKVTLDDDDDDKILYKSDNSIFLEKLKASYSSLIEPDDTLNDSTSNGFFNTSPTSPSLDDDDEDFSDDLNHQSDDDFDRENITH
ncbi:FNIP repeat-containing protein DDB_G0290617 isoform X1 [Aphidius gifuensis]|uniref:FNIP repeat-containing protein DDB_G0290617 isoform X1 n=1 Tax=Aphidius gifuensis TaxID=684658 RepID=UPI001CDB9E7B|nr:FNIP repeat-containing protein DDB_G0290617 isoform X1 [Aphidius gifuensis]